MSVVPLRGLVAATVTPMDPAGRIQVDSIPAMIDRLIDSGVLGLYVCGSTGEGMSLTTDERQQIANATVQAASGRVPVIVQVGHNSLIEAARLAEHAASVGADVISATCPSYFQVDDAETLARCMAEIASGSPDLPFYYYHIPALTGSTIDVSEFLKRGAELIPNLAGLKYTAPLLHEFQRLRGIENGKFDIVWGCDEMLLGALATGAQAAIGSTYNVAAPLYARIIDAFQSGQLDRAREFQSRSVAMVNVLTSFPFHAALKATMQMLQIPVGGCRLPINNLASDEVQLLRERLDAIGFFEWCGPSA